MDGMMVGWGLVRFKMYVCGGVGDDVFGLDDRKIDYSNNVINEVSWWSDLVGGDDNGDGV